MNLRSHLDVWNQLTHSLPNVSWLALNNPSLSHLRLNNTQLQTPVEWEDRWQVSSIWEPESFFFNRSNFLFLKQNSCSSPNFYCIIIMQTFALFGLFIWIKSFQRDFQIFFPAHSDPTLLLNLDFLPVLKLAQSYISSLPNQLPLSTSLVFVTGTLKRLLGCLKFQL